MHILFDSVRYALELIIVVLPQLDQLLGSFGILLLCFGILLAIRKYVTSLFLGVLQELIDSYNLGIFRQIELKDTALGATIVRIFFGVIYSRLVLRAWSYVCVSIDTRTKHPNTTIEALFIEFERIDISLA